MIHRLSKMIADFLLHKNVIPETKIDIYIYGYETVILGILDIFNNEYTYTVDCLNGSRTFQYCISSEFIPDSGMHTFQAIAIPANVTEDLTSYSTPKIRVQVS